VIHLQTGRAVYYDKLVMATESYLWVVSIKGNQSKDCFVYRTTKDLNAIEATARLSKNGVVVGGSLLGLEAAGALKALGVETHVLEFTPVLMAEQLDQQDGQMLGRNIESIGVKEHAGKNTKEITPLGKTARNTMIFADGSELEADFIVFSTGVRP
jgi:nitrite reductase (NADH) large subunit